MNISECLHQYFYKGDKSDLVFIEKKWVRSRIKSHYEYVYYCKTNSTYYRFFELI